MTIRIRVDTRQRCDQELNMADTDYTTDIKKYTSRDSVARERVAYLTNPQPHFETYGPKTRREFLSYLRLASGD